MRPTDDPYNFDPVDDPTLDAYRFNEDYPVPNLSSSDQISLYRNFAQAFDIINAFTNDDSEENNHVTNNRIPGMFLRLCFHDNTIDPNPPEFQRYIASGIDPCTKSGLPNHDT